MFTVIFIAGHLDAINQRLSRGAWFRLNTCVRPAHQSHPAQVRVVANAWVTRGIARRLAAQGSRSFFHLADPRRCFPVSVSLCRPQLYKNGIISRQLCHALYMHLPEFSQVKGQ